MKPERTARDPASQFWLRKRVLLTGGGGFVGSAVREALLRRGVPDASILVPGSRNLDLRALENCRQAVQGCDIVVHLAARTGGIAFARAHPASQYRDCSLINLNMLEAAREAGVAKFVTLGNLLAYPAIAQSPLTEPALQDGPVAATHLGVGLAKRDLVVLVEMYHREYGLDAVCVIGANAYGPRDRFDSAHAHVIPATIMKCFRDEELVVWGDGTPTRDFLYVDDLAEGILLAAEHLKAPGYVNVASGSEVSIADLVRMIAGLCGFRRRIVFDASKGGGDPRRVASTALADKLTGFSPRVPLEDGLRRTIDWYRQTTAIPVAR
jgi:GDP-L-fucose synthase